jgi:hypothetical protein
VGHGDMDPKDFKKKLFDILELSMFEEEDHNKKLESLGVRKEKTKLMNLMWQDIKRKDMKYMNVEIGGA